MFLKHLDEKTKSMKHKKSIIKKKHKHLSITRSNDLMFVYSKVHNNIDGIKFVKFKYNLET
jgi:hypothetical protein